MFSPAAVPRCSYQAMDAAVAKMLPDGSRDGKVGARETAMGKSLPRTMRALGCAAIKGCRRNDRRAPRCAKRGGNDESSTSGVLLLLRPRAAPRRQSPALSVGRRRWRSRAGAVAASGIRRHGPDHPLRLRPQPAAPAAQPLFRRVLRRRGQFEGPRLRALARQHQRPGLCGGGDAAPRIRAGWQVHRAKSATTSMPGRSRTPSRSTGTTISG